MSRQDHKFDEALISGYIDGELTQGDAQRVRLHLEGCEECRRLADDLGQLSNVTMATEFRVPEDTQWDESPRGTVSKMFHNSSWILGLLWVAGLAAYLIWQVGTDAQSSRFEGLIALGLLVAFGLAFLSTLFDRLQTRKNDPYRKVKK